MLCDKFTIPTVNFINGHFLQEDNLFLVRTAIPEHYRYLNFPENAIQYSCNLLNPKDFIDKKLIFHSLFDEQCVHWLYNNPYLLNHSYWMIWGGDLYNAPNDEINTFVRKNIYGIGSFCDNDLVKEKYGSNHVFFDTNMAMAPISITSENKINKIRNKNDATVIQINNSADDSTLEMLDILSKFKNENVQIRTVLSYGKVQFNQYIINKGKELFGDKFSYIAKMISPDDYLKYLADNDILILCQNRQQGGGNATTSLQLGKKVFIKSDVTTTQYFENNGIKIFDSNKIKDMNFNEFCEISGETIANNIKFIELLIDDEQVIRNISTVFNDILPKKI
jgi:hypothetical protein